MKVRVALLIFLPFAIEFSCTMINQKTQRQSLLKGKLVNLSGLDGCGWAIKPEMRKESEYLLPINLEQFSISCVEGMEVLFEYKVNYQSNICMAGQTVFLLKIKKP